MSENSFIRMLVVGLGWVGLNWEGGNLIIMRRREGEKEKEKERKRAR